MKVLVVTLLALLALSSASPLTRFRGLGFVSRTSHEGSMSESSSSEASSSSSSSSNSTESEDTVPIVSLQRIASNLTTASSLSFAVPKGHSKEYLFVTQQTGQLLVIDIDQVIESNDTDAATKWDDKDITPYLLLDLSDDVVELGPLDERGLLAAAFHPNFTDNGRFFMLYSSRTPAREGSSNPNNSRSCKASNGSLSSDCKLDGVDHVLKLVEYKVIEFPQNISAPISNDTASSSSAEGTADFAAIGKVQLVRNVLFIDQPFNNHLAAQSLAFNTKDGWLYLGLGDGGCQDDPFEYSLNKDSLFAKVIRIDVDGIESRNVSCSEPVQTFSKLADVCKNVSQSVEAFAYGVRNPAGIEFVADAQSKSTWAAVVPDAAGAQYDEINYMVDAGSFYGYSLREGFVCVNRSDLCSSASSNSNNSAFGADASAVQPVAVIAHDDPTTLYPSAIVGGHWYNGSITALKNKYVFASVASTKKGKLIGQGSLLFTDLAKLASSSKGLYNRTVTVSDCGNNATNAASESSEASEASEASSSHSNDHESKSPSGLPVSSVFIQYVWDLALDRFSTATGTNAQRSELIWAVNSAIDPKNRGGALYRVIPARKTTLGKAIA